ncbi:hypothetical protein D8I24_6495 [Cupriavidus necator H850]|jgi:hypothetical protein|nr:MULTISPECIES: hypothetical protein [Cupriavidus]KAI3597679.1 hypothetical protein D8I24_6495 [Cupriavidus necator H850]
MSYRISLIVTAVGLLIALAISLHAQYRWFKRHADTEDQEEH